MALDSRSVAQIVETALRPKVQVDGGDIELEKVEGDTVYLGAHADCASCPATSDCLRWWCEREIERLLGARAHVVIHPHVPYFKG